MNCISGKYDFKNREEVETSLIYILQAVENVILLIHITVTGFVKKF